MKHFVMSVVLMIALCGCGVDWFPAATVTISPDILSPATEGATYSQTLTGTGGTTPYTWAVLHGSLPAGLSLSTDGVLSGTPTEPGTFTFTVIVADSSTTKITGTKTYALVVRGVTAVTALPGAVAATAYSQTLPTPAGTAPFTWTLSSGTLPPGITLSTSGTISGTPTTSGDYVFALTVADSATPPGSATHEFSIHVTLPSSLSAGQSVILRSGESILVPSGTTVTTTSGTVTVTAAITTTAGATVTVPSSATGAATLKVSAQ